jgi:hypothetical protein
MRFGRFWGYLLFLDPNCYFLLVLIVCQLLEQLTLQLQLKLPSVSQIQRLSSMYHHTVHVTLVFVTAMYNKQQEIAGRPPFLHVPARPPKTLVPTTYYMFACH